MSAEDDRVTERNVAEWRHKFRFTTALLVSVGVTAAIWAIWIRPVDSGGEFQTFEQQWRQFSVLLIGLPLVLLFWVTVYESERRLWRYVAAGLVAPLLAAVTALAADDDHARQEAAEELFVEYTHRFPAGHFEEPAAHLSFEEKVLEPCARESENEERYTLFCLRIDYRADPDGEVIGGNRSLYDEDSGISKPFDCFGVMKTPECGEDPR